VIRALREHIAEVVMMNHKRKTRYTLDSVYVNKVKSPDLVHTYGNIDKKTYFM
jgi:hypothetical protein